MPKVHTHYDNLKVARDAPPELIRAAYRTLSQKYHPDKNPGNADAGRKMSIINTAYAVLSNDTSRRKHDEWIRAEEHEPSPQVVGGRQDPQVRMRDHAPPRTTPPVAPPKPFWPTGSEMAVAMIAGALMLGYHYFNPKTRVSGSERAAPAPTKAISSAPAAPQHQRSSLAPNGHALPNLAGYVSGYAQGFADGLSEVTVDNSSGDADVLVKLINLTGTHPTTARVFYIPAGGQFSAHDLRAGVYDVRYRNLVSGEFAKSRPIMLEEHATASGVRYSAFTLTLYKRRDGNTRMTRIAEEEFGR